MAIEINEANNPSGPVAIVDTDIFSYWFKGDIRGEPYREYAKGYYLALSFATVGELYHWSLRKRWGDVLKAKLREAISEFLIIPSDDQVCYKFAEARLPQYKGQPHDLIGYDDYWIAACALRFNCPIITNNYRHFSRIQGIKLLGPYSN